ncbi:MAG: hypothetical protein KF816_06285 [Melioribacteraceae bacterium]|nr:hypothetical protein [Melioribacteraceae bacterium]
MESNILSDILFLEQQIHAEDYKNHLAGIKEWGGADVIIEKRLDEDTKAWIEDQSTVFSFQKTETTRQVVITEYSKELSWLFYQLKKIFSSRIDYVSKYEFYGSLAQSAIEYLSKNKESENIKELLLAVLNKSKEFVNK